MCNPNSVPALFAVGCRFRVIPSVASFSNLSSHAAGPQAAANFETIEDGLERDYGV